MREIYKATVHTSLSLPIWVGHVIELQQLNLNAPLQIYSFPMATYAMLLFKEELEINHSPQSIVVFIWYMEIEPINTTTCTILFIWYVPSTHLQLLCFAHEWKVNITIHRLLCHTRQNPFFLTFGYVNITFITISVYDEYISFWLN